MKYDASLIRITHAPESSDSMYSIICLNAARLSLTLNGIRYYLDGKYMLCLSQDDRLSVNAGQSEAVTMQFLPYFYNVNLSHNVIGLSMYEEMRSRYGYPDFHLFRRRDESFIGILPLNDEEYELSRMYFQSAEQHISAHGTDGMWSCRTRSDMIALMRIAEGAYDGGQTGQGYAILRYIRDNLAGEINIPALCRHFHTNRTTLSNLIKEMTGYSPIQYVLEERLNQSRPDLLFTEMDIGEIAEKYGFTDMNYYIRAFKRRFGMTPLRYRVEGREKRMSEEAIYHERELRMMKKQDFERYIRLGLGRGITLLRAEEDKSPYLASLRAHLAEGGRLLGAYEKDLIDCFTEKGVLAAETAGMYLDRLKREYDTTGVPLLILLGYGDAVRGVAEQLYTQSYAEILDFTRHDVSGDRYPPCAKRYFSAVALLGRFLKAEPERIKRVMLDMADLYNYGDLPAVPSFQNPLFQVMDGIGRDTMYALMDEVAAEHPHGEKLHFRNYLKEFSRPVPDPSVTARDIADAFGVCGMQKNFEMYEKLWFSFANAPADTVRALAELLLAEQNPDKMRYLMSFFYHSIDPEREPPRFPLDPSPFIDAARARMSELPEGKFKSNEVSEIYLFLSRIRHPAIRAFGESILAETDEEHPAYRYAFSMVWGANYTDADEAVLRRYLEEGTDALRSRVRDVICDLARSDTPCFPDGLIPDLYASLQKNVRELLTKALIDGGRMPDSLLEESRYDCENRVRRMAEQESRRRQKKHMTAEEFEQFLILGHGRALRLLQAAKDKSLYRQPLIDFLTRPRFMQRSLGGRYEGELIDCFSDAAAIRQEIADILLPRLDTDLKNARPELLFAIGYRKPALEKLEARYKKAYAAYAESLKAGDEKRIEACFYDDYCPLVHAIVRDLHADMVRVKEILWEQADLYNYADKVKLPLLHLGTEWYRDEIRVIVDEIAREHPLGKKLRWVKPQVLPPAEKDVTVEKIFSEDGPDRFLALFQGLHTGPAETVLQVAEETVKSDDLWRMSVLASYFNPVTKEVPPSDFPLDPMPIAEMARRHLSETAGDDTVLCCVETLLRLLSRIRHPAVKALGREILADENANKSLRALAAAMVWGANYDPADHADFAAYLKTAEAYEKTNAFRVLCGLLKDGEKSISEDTVTYAFETADCYLRRNLVEALIETRRLPDTMLDDCLYDCMEETREAAEKY